MTYSHDPMTFANEGIIKSHIGQWPCWISMLANMVALMSVCFSGDFRKIKLECFGPHLYILVTNVKSYPEFCRPLSLPWSLGERKIFLASKFPK